MFEIITTLIISFVISLFVAFPLIKKFLRKDLMPSTTEKTESTRENLINLQREREAVFGELRDIEFDYGLGKLDDKDYKDLKDRYRYKAAGILKKIEEYSKLKSLQVDEFLDKEIEKEVLEYRNLRVEDQNSLVCNSCGEDVNVDNFCSKCGAALNE